MIHTLGILYEDMIHMVHILCIFWRVCIRSSVDFARVWHTPSKYQVTEDELEYYVNPPISKIWYKTCL